MEHQTEAEQPTLLVGSERICQQIAYVLALRNYVVVAKLTAQNWEPYRDVPIYVCEFKRKSRHLVGRKISQQLTHVQYFDDIGRTLDAEYEANRQRHANELPKPKSEPKSEPKKEKAPKVRQPLSSRLYWRARNFLGKVWYLMCMKFGVYKSLNVDPRAPKSKFAKLFHRAALHYLFRLKPSELLLYVLHAAPNPNIWCTCLEKELMIDENIDVKGCCSAMVPFGNLARDGELDEIFHSTYARIVKLSSLNRSYCLCNLNTWCKGYCGKGAVMPTEQWVTSDYPQSIALSFDKSCNLACQSCRSAHYMMNETQQKQTASVVEKLVRSGYLERSQSLTVAGMGEAFYSPYYRQLLKTEIKRKNINVLSNGTLFNESNWELLADKYNRINVDISVDAATAETYQKLRGADFENLMRNLNMLSDLRRQKQIHRLNLNFVVQRDNFREMPVFVQLGQSLGVDRIQFQRLNNFGNVATQDFLDRCLIINNEYLDYELWCVLQNPIFKDPIVDLRGFLRYIDASEPRYRQRYEKEKQHHSV